MGAGGWLKYHRSGLELMSNVERRPDEPFCYWCDIISDRREAGSRPVLNASEAAPTDLERDGCTGPTFAAGGSNLSIYNFETDSSKLSVAGWKPPCAESAKPKE